MKYYKESIYTEKTNVTFKRAESIRTTGSLFSDHEFAEMYNTLRCYSNKKNSETYGTIVYLNLKTKLFSDARKRKFMSNILSYRYISAEIVSFQKSPNCFLFVCSNRAPTKKNN